MIRYLGVWLLTVGAVGLAQAIPVRLPSTNEPGTPPGPQISVQGDWSGKLYISGVRLQFNPDGTLFYFPTKETNGKASTQGSWKLTGNEIYFEINNKASEYRGIVQGNSMSGDASNRAGMRGQFRLDRDPIP